MLYRTLFCFIGAASALQIQPMSRRELFAQVAAVAPLAAAAPAFADASNVYLGYTKSGVVPATGAAKVEDNYKGVAIGRPGALVNDNGAMIPEGTTHGTTRQVADFAGGAGDGKFRKTAAYSAAKARLMAQ